VTVVTWFDHLFSGGASEQLTIYKQASAIYIP